MHTLSMALMVTLIGLAGALAHAGEYAHEHMLEVHVGGIDAAGRLHKTHALCIPTIDGKSTRGENVRPNISWSPGPEGTKSYAVIVSDPDVPADLSRINDGAVIAEDASRQNFYHWVWFNLPANLTSIPAGPATIGYGHGANNSVSKTTNYDGPCPPTNDARIHHYHFTIVALDVARLRLAQGISAADAVTAIRAHAVAKGEAVGTFTLNPELRGGL